MKITKNAKRLMTMMMAFALLLSGLALAPAKAEAAGDAPSVTVKGATLRLDSTTGQSMRIGIEVDRADLAKSCGIKITNTANNKSVTVSTSEGYTNIYDADLNNNKIIYTAVIKDIPSTAFGTDFKIEGIVTDLEDQSYNTDGDVQKNVSDILTAICDEIDGSFMSSNGTLCKTVDEVDLETEFTDAAFDWGQGRLRLNSAADKASYQDGKMAVEGWLAYGQVTLQAGKYYVLAEVSSDENASVRLEYKNDGSYRTSDVKLSSEKQVLELPMSFDKTDYSAFKVGGDSAKFDLSSLKIGKVLTNGDLNDSFKYVIAEADVTGKGSYQTIVSTPLANGKNYGEKTLGDFEKVIIEYSSSNADVQLKVAIEMKNGGGSAFAKYNLVGSNNAVEIAFSDVDQDKYGGDKYKNDLAAAQSIPVKDAIINIVPTATFTGKVSIKGITLVEKS